MTVTSTLRDLIISALRLLGVVQLGEAPKAEYMEVAVYALDSLIDSWSTDNLMIYSENPYTFPLVAGQSQYTLGPGGDWDIPRPMVINIVKLDYSPGGGAPTVTIGMGEATDAQYAAVPVKSIATPIPRIIYDNGNYPLRTITLYPVPTQTQNIVLWLNQPLTDLTDLDATVSMPPGYVRAMRYNLAMELAPEFGVDLTEAIAGPAKQAKATIRRLNGTIAPLTFGISRLGTGYNWMGNLGYNIYGPGDTV